MDGIVWRYVSAAIAAGIIASVTATAMESVPKPRTLNQDGKKRTYHIHKPGGLRGKEMVPLLLVLHGGAQTAESAMKVTQFVKIAEENKFYVVFPEGLSIGNHKNQWADGRNQESGVRTDADVRFLEQIIHNLVTTENVDEKRVYMTGMSNGSMMTMRMICESSHLLAAGVAVIGSLPCRLGIPFGGAPECTEPPPDKERLCKPKEPVPLLLVFGSEDDWMPPQGGSIANVSVSGGLIMSQHNTARFWREQLDCGPSTESTVDKFPDDGTKVTHEIFPCSAPAALEVLTVQGMGHVWPGGHHGIFAQKILGRPTQEINSETLWKFMSRYTKPTSTPKSP